MAYFSIKEFIGVKKMDKKENYIICDACKENFDFKELKMLETWVDGEGEKLLLISFKCPRCEKEYKSALLDKECLRLRESPKNEKKREKLKIRMDELKFKYKNLLK